MTTQTRHQFTTIGCYVDESAGSADDCNERIVSFALDYGFPVDDELRAILDRIGTDDQEDDDSEFLSEAADEAETWLNENTDVPHFCYWTIEDNSLFLSPSVDSAREDDSVHVTSDLPSYILHVNDHGNAELYEVVLKSVWGIV